MLNGNTNHPLKVSVEKKTTHILLIRTFVKTLPKKAGDYFL